MVLEGTLAGKGNRFEKAEATCSGTPSLFTLGCAVPFPWLGQDMSRIQLPKIAALLLVTKASYLHPQQHLPTYLQTEPNPLFYQHMAHLYLLVSKFEWPNLRSDFASITGTTYRRWHSKTRSVWNQSNFLRKLKKCKQGLKFAQNFHSKHIILINNSAE